MLITIIICILIADFITGLIHWLEDTYAVPTWPHPLDTEIAIPNIDHHRRPNLIGSMSSFVNRNYQAVIPAACVGFAAIYFLGWAAWPVLLVAVLAAFGNEVHTWNHRLPQDNVWFVRFLQDAGIVQSRTQHNLHHKPPYDRYYCTLTSFTNAVLERINFWRGLEWVLTKTFGFEIKRGTPERDGF